MSVRADGSILFASSNLTSFSSLGHFQWAQTLGSPREGDVYSDPILGPEGDIYVMVRRNGLEDSILAVDGLGRRRWELGVSGSEGSAVMGKDGILRISNLTSDRIWLARDGGLGFEQSFFPGRTRTYAPLSDGGYLVVGQRPSDPSGFVRRYSSVGEQVWAADVDAAPMGGAVVNDKGESFVLLKNGSMVSVGASGSIRWVHPITEENPLAFWEMTPAVAADGTVYAALGSLVVALDPSGNRLWTVDTSRIGLVSPVLGADGTIYVGVAQGQGWLLAFEGSGAGPLGSGWPIQGGGGPLTRSVAQAPSIPQGVTNVTATFETFADRVELSWSHALGASSYRIWRSTTNQNATAVLLESDWTGSLTYVDWTCEAGVSYLYHVAGLNLAGEGPASTMALGRRRIARVGEVAWRFDLGAEVQGELAMNSSNMTFAVSMNGRLYCIDPLGRERWMFQWGGRRAMGPSLGDDGTIYFVGETPEGSTSGECALHAVSPEGQLKWVLPLGVTQPTEVSVGTNGMVYLTTCWQGAGEPALAHLLGISTEGKLKWDLPLQTPCSGRPLIGSDALIRVRSTDVDWWVVDSDGRKIGTIVGGEASRGEAALDGDLGLITGGNAIQAFNADGTSRWVQGNTDTPSLLCLSSGGSIHTALPGGRFRTYLPTGGVGVELSLESEVVGAAVDWIGTIWMTLASTDTGSRSLLRVSGGGQSQLEIRNVGRANTGPVIGDKLVTFGASGRYVHGVRTSLTPGNPAFWSHAGHNPARTGRANRPPSNLGPVSGLLATRNTRLKDVRISWNSLKGASTYAVMRSSTPILQDALELKEIFGALKWEDASGLPDTDYYYWVIPKNGAGKGASSGPVIGSWKRPAPGEISMDVTLGGPASALPAIDTNGVTYVSISQPYPDRPGHKRVVAVQSNGDVLWEFDPNAVEVGPVCVGDDGVVLFSTWSTSDFVARVSAVNSNGGVRWTRLASTRIDAPLALGWRGEVFAGDSQGELVALRSGDGSLIWSNRFDSQIASMAVDGNGTLYASTGSGITYAVNTQGSVLWSGKLGRSLFVGLEGVLVAQEFSNARGWRADGTGLGRLNPPNTPLGDLVMGSDGVIWSNGSWPALDGFDPRNTNVWHIQIPARSYRRPALAHDGTIYLQTEDWSAQAYDPNGNLLWSTNLIGAVYGPILSADGQLTFGMSDSRLVKVHAGRTPSDLGWPMELHDARHTCRSPAGQGAPEAVTRVVVATEVHTEGTEVSWESALRAGQYEVWRSDTENLAHATNISGFIGGTTRYLDSDVTPGKTYQYWVRGVNSVGPGPFVWSGDAPGTGPKPGDFLGKVAEPYVDGRMISLGLNGLLYSATESALHALRSDLTIAWSRPIAPMSILPVHSDGTISVITRDGDLYSLDGEGRDLGRHWRSSFSRLEPWSITEGGHPVYPGPGGFLYCQNARDGKLIWSYKASGDDPNPIRGVNTPSIGPDGDLVFAGSDGMLHRLRPDGRLRWRYPLTNGVWPPPVLGQDGSCYFSTVDGVLRSLDAQGRERWSNQFGPSSVWGMTVSREGVLVVTASDGTVRAIERDGRLRWTRGVGEPVQSSVCLGDDGVVYWISALGVLETARIEDGSRVWSYALGERFPGAKGLVAPFLVNHRLYVHQSPHGLMGFAVSSKPARASWNQYRGNPQRTGRLDSAVRASWDLSNAELRLGEPAAIHASLDEPDRVIVGMELLRGSQVLAKIAPQVSNSVPASTLVWTRVEGLIDDLRLRVTDHHGIEYLTRVAPKEIEPDSANIIQLIPTPAGSWQLKFRLFSGVGYIIERSQDMEHWTSVGERRVATQSIETWVDPDPQPRLAYYRIRLVPE